jgi:hypothetical protein
MLVFYFDGSPCGTVNDREGIEGYEPRKADKNTSLKER